MAARKKKSAAVEAIELIREHGVTPEIKPGFDVRSVPLASPKLIEIDQHSDVWERVFFPGTLVDMRAYFKLQPPEGVSEETIEKVRSKLFEKGALAVRVMPIARTAKIVSATRETAKVRETLREACCAIVETLQSKDRDALSKVVESAMSKVGI